MNRLKHPLAVLASILAGILLSSLVPVFNLPFGGCTSRSLLASDPHCGYWPEILRGVLLVVPVAFLMKSKALLGIVSFGLVVLAMAGGIIGIKMGQHFSWGGEAMATNLISQAPALAASIPVLLVGYAWRNRASKSAV